MLAGQDHRDSTERGIIVADDRANIALQFWFREPVDRLNSTGVSVPFVTLIEVGSPYRPGSLFAALLPPSARKCLCNRDQRIRPSRNRTGKSSPDVQSPRLDWTGSEKLRQTRWELTTRD